MQISNRTSLSWVLNSIPTLIWVLNTKNELVYANRACEIFWGAENKTQLNQKIKEFLATKESEELITARNKVFEIGEETRVEQEVKGVCGKERWMNVELTPVLNNQGEVTEITFTGTDITDRKQAEEELRYYGMHDWLTGLYNRDYFEEEMRRLDTERHYPISVAFCDVDGLKLANDLLGHEKGDELIAAAAAAVKKPFRASDVVARVGGDEFAVILPGTDEETARKLCERIRKAVGEYNRGEQVVPLSISVGFATAKEAAKGINVIFKQADNNMYEEKSKNSGLAQQRLRDYHTRLLLKKDFLDDDKGEKLRRLVQMLGQAVGLSFQDMDKLLLLSRLHDLGKVLIDDNILFKKGELSVQEREIVRQHPNYGYRIARSFPEMAQVADLVMQAHERWDGSGYPKGLKGEEIHLFSRILAVADAYQAMTSPRPYRPAFAHEEALIELQKSGRKQFDPRLVDIFVSLVDQEILTQDN